MPTCNRFYQHYPAGSNWPAVGTEYGTVCMVAMMQGLDIDEPWNHKVNILHFIYLWSDMVILDILFAQANYLLVSFSFFLVTAPASYYQSSVGLGMVSQAGLASQGGGAIWLPLPGSRPTSSLAHCATAGGRLKLDGDARAAALLSNESPFSFHTPEEPTEQHQYSVPWGIKCSRRSLESNAFPWIHGMFIVCRWPLLLQLVLKLYDTLATWTMISLGSSLPSFPLQVSLPNGQVSQPVFGVHPS